MSAFFFKFVKILNMSVCGAIIRGSQVSCNDINISGTNSTAYLINYDDIDRDQTVITNGRITTLQLLPNKYAYPFTGAPSHVKISQDTVDFNGIRHFKHTVGITIYERTAAQKINMAQMARGLFVAIIHLKGKDDDAIIVAGYECGLEHTASNIMDAFANGGYYVFNFSTNDADGQFERNLIASLGIDYADALSILNSITATPDWILAGGIWDDAGIWDDSSLWID
jgi:hypothetical protein